MSDSAELDEILKEGDQRRRARRFRWSAGFVVTAVLALGATQALDDDNQDDVALGGPDETTTAAPTPSSASTTSTIPTTTATSTTAAPAPSTSSSTSTAPAMTCRNSRDPSCGPFRWEPEPANAPLSLSVEASSTSPAVGEEVVVRIVADDPDARISEACIGVGWGDGPPPASCADACSDDGQRYGPWDPPPAAPGYVELTLRHAYTAAGTYNVAITARSLSCEPLDTYESAASHNFTVVVS